MEYIAELEDNRSNNAITIYIDQAKFYDKPDIRTMWVLRGKKAEVPTNRSGRKKMMLYGAYSPQNQFLYTEEVLEETSEQTASFFITLRARFPHKRLDIVLDNAPWHSGDEVRRIAKRYNIHLHYLPPYSPDLNPIEPLWLWIRQEKTYNYDYNTFKEKKQEIFSFIEKISLQPEQLKRRLVIQFKF
jgi:transposase